MAITRWLPAYCTLGRLELEYPDNYCSARFFTVTVPAVQRKDPQVGRYVIQLTGYNEDSVRAT